MNRIDRVFVINLARRPENKARIATRLANVSLGVHVDFFRAVDALELSDGYMRALGVAMFQGWKIPGASNRYYARDMKLGEIGCSLSHYFLWKRVCEEGIGAALILEDDASFVPAFADVLEERLESLGTKDPNWDLCYVGRKRLIGTPYGHGPEIVFSSGVVIPSFSYCSHAYMITQAGARKLLDTRFHERIIPVDEFLPALYCRHPRDDVHEMFGQRGVRAYAIEPSLSFQDGGPSDTETSALTTPSAHDASLRWASAAKRRVITRKRKSGPLQVLVFRAQGERAEVPFGPELAPLICWMADRDEFTLNAAAAECPTVETSLVVRVIDYLTNARLLTRRPPLTATARWHREGKVGGPAP